MTNQHTPARILLAAAAMAISVSSWADSFTLDFDSLAAGSNANADLVAQANGLSFASSYVDDIVDADFNVLGQHWLAYNDAVDHQGVDPAIFVREPSPLGWGIAPSGSNALDARFDQVMLHFAAPTQLTSVSFDLAQGGYAGNLGASTLLLLDANGVQIGQSYAFNQSTDSGLALNFANPVLVSAILLPSGKFYDNISVTTAVPEPESWAMLAVGLGLLSAVVRKRKAA
jgi:hypothetical protein